MNTEVKRKTFYSAIYKIFVEDDSGNNYMEKWNIDAEPYGKEWAFSHIEHYLEEWHNYKPSLQKCVVTNCLAFFNLTAQEGIDFTIIDLPLYCKKQDLAIGDVYESVGMVKYENEAGDYLVKSYYRTSTHEVVTASSPLLVGKAQGYRSFHIVGGPKLDALQRNPKKVATYSKLLQRWNWGG